MPVAKTRKDTKTTHEIDSDWRLSYHTLSL